MQQGVSLPIRWGNLESYVPTTSRSEFPQLDSTKVGRGYEDQVNTTDLNKISFMALVTSAPMLYHCLVSCVIRVGMALIDSGLVLILIIYTASVAQQLRPKKTHITNAGCWVMKSIILNVTCNQLTIL